VSESTFGVVVHVTEADPDRFKALMRNAANLRADLGPEPAIELVVHGPGVALLLTGSPLREQLSALPGVTGCACSNSLRSLERSAEDLLPGVRVVPSGVGWLIRRQREGWLYLRL
jgi:intracellular sulfur oxidation DsrE/DsrF family protein